MSGERVLISLGSNIDPRVNLPRAIARLASEIDVVAVSSLYASAARGSPGAPPFLNAALAADSSLDPYQLKFGVLRPLEAELGRVRSADRNAPRPIDLDLALYGDHVIDDVEGGLRVPDPDIETCAHVALPLAEIAPATRHPVLGTTLNELATRLRDRTDIRIVAPPPRPGGPGG